MDGTFGGGDLISASLAIMLGGGTDAELHDKEVTLTTSDVTGSQTVIFEYDPQNEPTTGTPPGPWDGYSLFTIDLSGVKDDIEDLQQQLDELEDCRDAVIAKIQEYDPQFDPQSCQDIVDKWDEEQEEISDLEDEVEACHDCKDEVVVAIQQYIPDYQPDPDECPAPKIPDVYQKGRDDEATENPPGVTVPDGVDPEPIALELNGAVTDNDIHASVQIVCRVSSSPDVYVPLTKITRPPYNVFMPFAKVTYIEDGAQVTRYYNMAGSYGLNTNGDYGEITSWSVASDGTISFSGIWHNYTAAGWSDTPITGGTHDTHLVGFGDTGHTQRITN